MQFDVQALTHAKILPQICFARTAAYLPGGAPAQVFKSSSPQKMSRKARGAAG